MTLTASGPATGTLDVQAFINAQPLSGYQWRIVALCFLIVFLDGLDTAAMGFIAPALSQEWGIDRASLGPVMSAALIGMVFGALGSGPLADRFGRKVVLVVAVFLFGIFSLASAYSSNIDQLLVLRLLTGLGLGAAMPNATTLLSEYTPERLKSLLVTSMFCGFNLGMACGGFVSAKLIPSMGWHSLLMLGGILPLVLAVVLMVWLPESARFLVVRNRGAEQIRKVLAPIAPKAVAGVTAFTVPEQKTVSSRNVLKVIFSGTYSAGTLLLWLTYFMGLVIVYLLTSWLPTLMRDSGASMEQSAFIGALFQFGGVLSAVGVGWAMDRYNPHKVIGFAYALAGVFAYLVGQSLGNVAVLATLVLLAGMCINGAQSAMPSLAARFYPTQGRATGVSWMLGIGRFGAILGA
ncbi:4-hydroxybenzoate transporter, partial [Pseudomonas syringae pv. actinidiae ICMP 18886]